MIFHLFRTITIISILFYLFISIRAIIIGLIHQDATLLDRGLKIFAFSFLIIISSIAILLFMKTQISPQPQIQHNSLYFNFTFTFICFFNINNDINFFILILNEINENHKPK